MTIHLKVSEKEVQDIIDALASRPYAEVYQIIPKIIDQANQREITAPYDKGSPSSPLGKDGE